MRSSWLYLATRSDARRRARLDLAAVGRDGEVGDRGVLGLAGAVAHHAAVAGRWARSTASSVSVSVPIWLTLTSTALAAPCSMPRASRVGVGDEQVVADDLDRVAELLGHRDPAVPVLLGQRVLDRDDRVVGPPASCSRRSSRRPILAAPSNWYAAVAVELGGGDVEGERDVAAQGQPGLATASPIRSSAAAFESRFGREATLVAESGRQALALQHRLQRVVDLGALAQRLGERRARRSARS